MQYTLCSSSSSYYCVKQMPAGFRLANLFLKKKKSECTRLLNGGNFFKKKNPVQVSQSSLCFMCDIIKSCYYLNYWLSEILLDLQQIERSTSASRSTFCPPRCRRPDGGMLCCNGAWDDTSKAVHHFVLQNILNTTALNSFALITVMRSYSSSLMKGSSKR